MNCSIDSSHRTRFEGLRKIVQFNWPFYLLGTFLLAAGALGLILLSPHLPSLLIVSGGIALALAAWWLGASLLASHWIYDRSRIYDFDWLDLPPPENAAILTAGFDESLPGLTRKFPDTEWALLNFFDADSMSEPSIRRAMERYPLSGEWKSCQSNRWPVEDEKFDLVVFPFSAHELRSSDDRIALFKEAKRKVNHGGRILLIEHLRDLPNAIAFGPGFFHFHSQKTWQADFEAAALQVENTQSLTCFVDTTVLSVEAADLIFQKPTRSSPVIR